MPYQLTILIDPQGLQQILSAGESVVVANDPSSPGGPPVAWLVFQPVQSNDVTWDSGTFSVYASNTVPQPGAVIIPFSTADAQLGSIYTLESSMSFSAASDGPADVATIENSSGGQATVGLQQSATVNGTSAPGPISAAALPQGVTGGFAPGNTVQVFVASANENGSVLAQIPPNAAKVKFSSQNPTATLVYNDATGGFMQQ